MSENAPSPEKLGIRQRVQNIFGRKDRSSQSENEVSPYEALDNVMDRLRRSQNPLVNHLPETYEIQLLRLNNELRQKRRGNPSLATEDFLRGRVILVRGEYWDHESYSNLETEAGHASRVTKETVEEILGTTDTDPGKLLKRDPKYDMGFMQPRDRGLSQSEGFSAKLDNNDESPAGVSLIIRKETAPTAGKPFKHEGAILGYGLSVPGSTLERALQS